MRRLRYPNRSLGHWNRTRSKMKVTVQLWCGQSGFRTSWYARISLKDCKVFVVPSGSLYTGSGSGSTLFFSCCLDIWFMYVTLHVLSLSLYIYIQIYIFHCIWYITYLVIYYTWCIIYYVFLVIWLLNIMHYILNNYTLYIYIYHIIYHILYITYTMYIMYMYILWYMYTMYTTSTYYP